jgi:hypothetical protein
VSSPVSSAGAATGRVVRIGSSIPRACRCGGRGAGPGTAPVDSAAVGGQPGRTGATRVGPATASAYTGPAPRVPRGDFARPRISGSVRLRAGRRGERHPGGPESQRYNG